MSQPEIDDRGPLTDDDAQGMDADPICEWCGDTTYRWTIRDGQAARARCDRCMEEI